MSVQSVKNSLLKQSPAASAIQPVADSDPATEFSDLLQQVGNTFRMGVDSTVNAGGLTAAIKQSDAANAQSRVDAPRDTNTRQDSKSDDGQSQRNIAQAARPAHQTRKADHSDKQDQSSNNSSQQGQADDGQSTQTVAAPQEKDAPAAVAVQADAAPVDETVVFDPTSQQIDPSQFPQLLMQQQAQVVQVQQQVGPQVQQGPQMAAVQQKAADTALQQTDQQGKVFDPTTVMAGPQVAHKMAAGNNRQAQAADLAQRLDDPSTQFNVQVSVSNQAKATDVSAVAQQVATDLPRQMDVSGDASALSQAKDPNQIVLTPDAPSGLQAVQGQTQAQAVPDSASTLAAVLAAQSEATSSQQAAPSVSTSNNTENAQPIAGVGAANATQASQKTAQTAATIRTARPQITAKPEELTEQIAVHITQNQADGTDTIKVNLKPLDLGSVEVKMNVTKDGTVNTVVTVDNQDTLDLMKKDQQGLEQALRDAGLKTANGSLSFNLRGDGQQQNAQQGNGQQPRRSRLSAAAAIDATSAQSAAQAQARWTGRNGVNLSV